MKKLLLIMLLLIPTIAYPTCTNNGNYSLEVTVTNMTPILEHITIDILSNQTSGTECFIRIYDSNTSIANYYPENIKRDSSTELNLLNTLIGNKKELILTEAHTAHLDIFAAPYLFRTDYPFDVYVECGQTCDTTTIYLDHPRALPLEKIIESIIFSLLYNPFYWIMATLSAIIILTFLKILISLF